jgi:uncharacterized protein DUF6785/uncharacterized protein DUF6784
MERDVTFRAVLIGLLLGAGIAGGCWFNDRVMHQAGVAQNMLPTSVYGLLLLALLVNPVLRVCRVRLRASEWGVILALALVGVVVAGPALLWHFSQATVLPHERARTEIGWKTHHVMDYAADALLVDAGGSGSAQYNDVVERFKGGRPPGHGATHVPWKAWRGPLGFWVPMIALLHIACIALVLIVHRQWSHRERLPYPIATFATELLTGTDGSGWPDLFFCKRFWLGFAVVFGIMFLDRLRGYVGGLVTVPLFLDFTAITQKWPYLTHYVTDLWHLRPRIVFLIIGLSYFIATDASFSLGIGSFLFVLVEAALVEFWAVETEGHYFVGGLYGFQMFGSYLGLAMVILYVGRRHYASVLAQAMGICRGDPVEGHVRWAARVLVLATAGMVLLLRLQLGLAWTLAVLFSLLMLMMFLVAARLIVETGMTSLHMWWHPVSVLLGLFGFGALGPNMLLTLGMLSGVLTIEPRVSMVAMGVHALKIGESTSVRPRRLAPWLFVAAMLGLSAGLVGTIYTQYTYGVDQPGWSGTEASKMPYDVTVQRLQSYAGDREGWETLRWSHFLPDRRFLWGVGGGVALVVLCSALRMRFTWWPIHPIMFLVWNTWPLLVLGFSFFLGWMCKWAITHFGGGKAYRDNRPLFLGIIAGELGAHTLFALWGLVYYATYRVPPPGYWFAP